jgi:DNA polymerase
MVVGEAPGADEDKTGRPFVGAAGERLNSWIEAVGLERQGVFIANVLKCRPPNNRDPFGPEVAACSKFLRAQIRAVRPELLVALGRFAASALLGKPVRMHEATGRLHSYRDPRDSAERPVCVLYHPAYVLRQDGQTDTADLGKSENEKVIEEFQRAVTEIFGSRGPI